MNGDEARSPVEWLRSQVEADLGIARHILDKRGARPDPRREMHDAIADCEAKLAILDRCEPLLPDDDRNAEDYYDGRDDWEVQRDEALAGLADDILALLADGYKHRPGWADHWACPGCGKPLHEVPDGHSWAIPLTGGPWTCSDPGSPGGKAGLSMHMTGAPGPGARLSVFVPPGCDLLGEMPPPDGWGFAATMNNDRWRAVVQSAAQAPDGGWTLELEVQGRHQEDQR